MCSFIINQETIADSIALVNLHSKLFGPARFTRAAHLIRENGCHRLDLCFTIYKNNNLIGSIRITPILIGQKKALLLGPLAIDHNYHGIGLGSKLMKKSMKNILAKKLDDELIFLIGDFAYYNKFGFKHIDASNIILPSPVDKKRILAFEIHKRSTENLKGYVRARE